jgi:RNA polymerase sigma-70 factor, ECF subfamily
MDEEDTEVLVRCALDGDQGAQTRLVAVLTPVIQARVARTLRACRTRFTGGRDVHQEVEDLTQEVFLALFADDARVLRSWQAERGLSLENFVGLVAERQVKSVLRSGKRSPWKEEPSLPEDLDRPARESDPETIAAGREQLRLLLDRLQCELSPYGWHLFDLLFIRELPVSEVMSDTGLSDFAVYKWRSRLRRLARRLQAEMSGNGKPERRNGEDAEDE